MPVLRRRLAEENTQTRDAVIALGRKARIYVCDLADKAQVARVVPTVTGEWNEKIDILVNCGGIQRRHSSEDFPDSDWEEVLQVNLSTCFTLARDTAKHMLTTRKEGDDRGKIINIASLVSFQGASLRACDQPRGRQPADDLTLFALARPQAERPFPPTPPPSTASSA